MSSHGKIELLKSFAKAWFGNSQQHSIHAQMLRARGLTKLADKIMAEAEEEWNEAKKVNARLYACAKEVVRQYRKPLEALNLTYTQYIVMMVFWEYGGMTEKELGEQVKLDSGTLAPLLRRLEKQGLVTRERPEGRENVLFIRLTERGEALKHQATGIPDVIKDCLGLTPEEGLSLRLLLNKAMKNMQSTEVITND